MSEVPDGTRAFHALSEDVLRAEVRRLVRDTKHRSIRLDRADLFWLPVSWTKAEIRFEYELNRYEFDSARYRRDMREYERDLARARSRNDDREKRAIAANLPQKRDYYVRVGSDTNRSSVLATFPPMIAYEDAALAADHGISWDFAQRILDRMGDEMPEILQDLPATQVFGTGGTALTRNRQGRAAKLIDDIIDRRVRAQIDRECPPKTTWRSYRVVEFKQMGETFERLLPVYAVTYRYDTKARRCLVLAHAKPIAVGERPNLIKRLWYRLSTAPGEPTAARVDETAGADQARGAEALRLDHASADTDCDHTPDSSDRHHGFGWGRPSPPDATGLAVTDQSAGSAGRRGTDQAIVATAGPVVQGSPAEAADAADEDAVPSADDALPDHAGADDAQRRRSSLAARIAVALLAVGVGPLGIHRILWRHRASGGGLLLATVVIVLGAPVVHDVYPAQRPLAGGVWILYIAAAWIWSMTDAVRILGDRF
jgi:hypothetical protein